MWWFCAYNQSRTQISTYQQNLFQKAKDIRVCVFLKFYFESLHAAENPSPSAVRPVGKRRRSSSLRLVVVKCVDLIRKHSVCTHSKYYTLLSFNCEMTTTKTLRRLHVATPFPEMIRGIRFWDQNSDIIIIIITVIIIVYEYNNMFF